MNLQSIVRPSVWQLSPYRSARNEYTGAKATAMLDANENPYEWPYSRYPDPVQSALKQRLAALRDVRPEQILVGNGSDEVIDLLMRLTCQPATDRILTLDPSYGMYRVSAAINDVPLDVVKLNTDLTVNTEAVLSAIDNHKLILLCSPNNPDGGLQTFSKSWAAAGIRVGMAYANEEVIALLHKIKPPYNVSAPAQEAALEVLADFDILQKQIEEIKIQRDLLATELQQLAIVKKVYPSQANFLLVQFQDAAAIYELLKSQWTRHRQLSRGRLLAIPRTATTYP